MTDISSVASTTAAAPAAAGTGLHNAAATTSAPSNTMDSQMFLKLLVTQLKNQDPSSPMDTNQMISQTTQLSMMQELTTLAGTSSSGYDLQMKTSAAALVGQRVSYTDSTGATVAGTATAVSFAGTTPTVTIGGTSVPLDSISGVAAAATASTAPIA
ncbi:flagellar hook capping FlgD N-terminal domain-containing protein [Gryllotalpicola sp.]|uniref:flagellar hook assembly protein FlgD n=1 Tax=Gryllotalpicola sp. TaxID=1932787 RepID=UPI0026270496|nr:flagellar hook capping FlgD N-terminal domain-containing protein [Gryllotalpicola sp.]